MLAVANNTAAECMVLPRLYTFTACPLCRGVAVLKDNERLGYKVDCAVDVASGAGANDRLRAL